MTPTRGVKEKTTRQGYFWLVGAIGLDEENVERDSLVNDLANDNVRLNDNSYQDEDNVKGYFFSVFMECWLEG